MFKWTTIYFFEDFFIHQWAAIVCLDLKIKRKGSNLTLNIFFYESVDLTLGIGLVGNNKLNNLIKKNRKFFGL